MCVVGGVGCMGEGDSSLCGTAVRRLLSGATSEEVGGKWRDEGISLMLVSLLSVCVSE